MKLAEIKIREYLNQLKSSSPAPGGGSASALAGAQGMGLMIMVCDLTIGRSKYAETEPLCMEVKEKGLEIFEELIQLIDKDTEAYNQVSEAFKMPKDTDAEKEVRSKAIAAATLAATEIPYRVMELCVKGIMLTDSLVGKTNSNASSDLGVAALNLHAGVKGAWMNVKINLPGVKDLEKAEFYEKSGMEMVNATEEILHQVEAKIME